MAREILFKAKRIDNGEWVEGYLFKSFTGVSYIMTQFDHILGLFEYFKVDEATICQYTGLTDKNGNKIWENDIYEYLDSGERFVIRYGPYTQSNIQIKDTNLGFYAEWQGNTSMRKDLLYWFKQRDIEYIGNIFDNPELLMVNSMYPETFEGLERKYTCKDCEEMNTYDGDCAGNGPCGDFVLFEKR